jgi:hypothetical protein
MKEGVLVGGVDLLLSRYVPLALLSDPYYWADAPAC